MVSDVKGLPVLLCAPYLLSSPHALFDLDTHMRRLIRLDARTESPYVYNSSTHTAVAFEPCRTASHPHHPLAA